MGGVRAAAALAMLVLCACGSAPLAQPAQTAGDAINVAGTVDRGPIATCPADEPCDPPAVASALVFSREGAPPVTVRVGPDGSFALHLDPGAYAIAAAPPVFHGGVEPSSVRVPDTGTVFFRLRIVRSP
jgi:hypothetical protein